MGRRIQIETVCGSMKATAVLECRGAAIPDLGAIEGDVVPNVSIRPKYARTFTEALLAPIRALLV